MLVLNFGGKERKKGGTGGLLQRLTMQKNSRDDVQAEAHAAHDENQLRLANILE